MFIFLIERGLKRLVPLLTAEAARRRTASPAGDAAVEEVPVLRVASVLYPVPKGVCAAPVQTLWVKSSELVKTPVYLYHFWGDKRDAPAQDPPAPVAGAAGADGMSGSLECEV